MPWRSWLNAEIYDRFVRERQIYDWLNRRIVQRADLRRARRVLDLGCGTGATTQACLGAIPADAEIVGIDASAEMVDVARNNVHDPRASFEVATASQVEHFEGPFDRVVCNAAFWQFPRPQEVFRALARRTSGGARFVFNVPAERVVGERGSIHPFQVALLHEVETQAGRPLQAQPIRIDPERIDALACEEGFEPVSREREVYEGLQGELIELMSIPAMIVPLTLDLSDAQREEAWNRARERSDPGLVVRVPWVFFTFARCGEG